MKANPPPVIRLIGDGGDGRQGPEERHGDRKRRNSHRSSICTWGEYLAREDCEAVAPLLRLDETTGRPISGDAFLATIGCLIGRNLMPNKPGPKPKRRSNDENKPA